MDIITVCPFCGVAHVITVRPDDYLAAEEREMLISGICPDCWDDLDGIDDEDDFIASDF